MRMTTQPQTRVYVLLAFAALLPHAPAAQTIGAAGSQPPNILLIIGDDMGVETLASYGVGAETAATPTLDALAASGLRFNSFWSQPVCSPTRATLLTGRYGFRTGVGRPTGDAPYAGDMPDTPAKPAGAPAEGRGGPPGRQRNGAAADQGRRANQQGGGFPPGGPGLRSDEFTLPMAFASHAELGYATAAIGKWHLADTSNGWEKHPNLVGFDHFSGLLRGFPDGYFAWTKLTDGQFMPMTGYAPSDKIGDAVRWISDQGDRPWFLWLAFNLPHMPLHLPPKELWVTDHSDLDPQADPDANPFPYFIAMMEAMDTEIGRLLGSIDPDVLSNTYIIFMGDNGTARQVVTSPFSQNHAKGGVYEGGVNVPLIVKGPGVAQGRASDALANSTDLFATIMELATIDPDSTIPDGVVTDSVSLVPYLSAPDRTSLRRWIYADVFGPDEGVLGGQYAIRGERYKLVVRNGREELYDLAEDRAEANNLLSGALDPGAQAALAELRSEVAALHASEN